MCMPRQTRTAKSNLVRKQVLITPEQNRALKEIAVSSRRSEGEVIRRAVDLLREKEAEELKDWRAGLEAVRGMWADRTDLDELYAEARARRLARRQRTIRQMQGE